MSVSQLRAVTYLCPSLPVELFQAILELLEEETGLQATLLYDWRAEGPAEAKPSPFLTNDVDIGNQRIIFQTRGQPIKMFELIFKGSF